MTDVSIELPQLRPGSAPRSLDVEGAAIDVISSDLQGTSGTDTLWKVRLQATADPGVVPIVLRAVYADGRSVEVDQSLTVVPASEEEGFPWPAAIGRRAPRPRRGGGAHSYSLADKPDSVTARALPAVPGRRPRLCVVSGR